MDAAWVLNLDADLELGARGPYTPTHATLRAMRAQRERLASTLLSPGDLLVDDESPRGSAKGRPGFAFCPTPRAIAQLERAGAVPVPHPPVEVLRRVNGRAFCASLGVTLPGSAFVTNLESACATIASGSRPWRVKRAFGMAGHGQRVLGPGALAKGDLDFVRAGIARGGVVIEPNLVITTEVALHGVIEPSGALALGRIVRQRCDARGGWMSTDPFDAANGGDFPFAQELEDEAVRVARSLHAAGYFGPFGVDAFRYEGGFQRRSEINARFSMGFPIGMPQWRARVPVRT